MRQIKIIYDRDWQDLEKRVNEFIKNKDVINVSFNPVGGWDGVLILFNQPIKEVTCD